MFETLVRFHDGELSDEEAERLRERLAVDPALRAELAEVRGIADVLEGVVSESRKVLQDCRDEAFAGALIGCQTRITPCRR